jgi:hypothetical protein
VAEDDVLQHCLGDAQQLRNLLLNLCAVVVYFKHLAVLVLRLQGLLDRFELPSLRGDCKERPSLGQHGPSVESSELEPGIAHQLALGHHFRVHDEVLPLVAGGRKRTSRNVLQHFNDGLIGKLFTVFPEPFLPQISVSGVSNYIF